MTQFRSYHFCGPTHFLNFKQGERGNYGTTGHKFAQLCVTPPTVVGGAGGGGGVEIDLGK